MTMKKDHHRAHRKRAAKLPPDPEEMNDERSDWAQAGLDGFMTVCRTDAPDALPDLLADFGHWCDRNGEDFGALLKRAAFHYNEETGGKGEQFEILAPNVADVRDGQTLSNPTHVGFLDFVSRLPVSDESKLNVSFNMEDINEVKAVRFSHGPQNNFCLDFKLSL